MAIETMMMRLMGKIPKGHNYYKGKYRDGDAAFTYLDSNDTILFDGMFRFTRNRGGRKLMAKGSYAGDLKDGEWSMSRKSNNRVLWTEAFFSEGRLTGELFCHSEEQMISGYRSQIVVVYVKNGFATGQVTGNINGGLLTGQLDEAGYPDGYWSLTFSNEADNGNSSIECEKWEHGVLRSSWTKNLYSTKRTYRHVGIFQHVEYLLKAEVQPLLNLIHHGATDQHIRMQSTSRWGQAIQM